MNILKQVLIIFSITFVGVCISKLLPFVFPSSLISLFLLLLLLVTKTIKLTSIKETAEFLLGNMAFFFVPSGVAVIEQYSFLKGKIIILIFICIVSTIITFLATAYSVKLIIHIMKKGEHINERNSL